MLVIPLQLWLEQKSQFEVLVIPVEASGFHGGETEEFRLEGMGVAVDQSSCVCPAPTPTPAPKGPSGLIFHLGHTREEANKSRLD